MVVDVTGGGDEGERELVIEGSTRRRRSDCAEDRVAVRRNAVRMLKGEMIEEAHLRFAFCFNFTRIQLYPLAAATSS